MRDSIARALPYRFVLQLFESGSVTLSFEHTVSLTSGTGTYRHAFENLTPGQEYELRVYAETFESTQSATVSHTDVTRKSENTLYCY